MRVLWVTNDLPPRAGGIQQFVANLLERVHPDQTVVIGPAQEGAERHDRTVPYEVVRHDGGVWPTPGLLRRLREVAAGHRPDVIVLGASWPLGELGGALARDPGVPVVALTHGLEAGLTSAKLGWLVRRATRHLSAVTTISDWTEQRLRGHVAASRIERIPPGVDLARFRPDLDGAGMRREWAIPDDATLVGCISRLVARKGQDSLLAAWPELAPSHPDAWLVLVGGGPLESELRRAAASLDRVVVAGEVEWSRLPACYAALDVFAMPCRTRLAGLDVEGLGIVYLEAQATGVPVVGGRSGGAPEAILEDRTGLVVDGRSVDEVADALDRLLSAPDQRQEMGRAGRGWVEQGWGWDTIAARFVRLLDEVADAGRGHDPDA